MDGISAAASIIGIATAGAQISIKLITLAEQVRTASDRISVVAHDVALTSAILQQLGDFVNPKPDDGISIFNQSGLQTTTAFARICERIFIILQSEVGKASLQFSNIRRSSPEVQITLSRLEKLKWPFLQPSMEILRKDLREAKGTLTLILQVASLAYTKKVAAFNRKGSGSLLTETQDDLIEVIKSLAAQDHGLLQSLNGSGLGASKPAQEQSPAEVMDTVGGSANRSTPIKLLPNQAVDCQVATPTTHEEEIRNGKSSVKVSLDNERRRHVSGDVSVAAFPDAPETEPISKQPYDTTDGISLGNFIQENVPEKSNGGNLKDSTGDFPEHFFSKFPSKKEFGSSSGITDSVTSLDQSPLRAEESQKFYKTVRDEARIAKPGEGTGNKLLGRLWYRFGLRRKQRSKGEFGAEHKQLQIYFQKPYIRDFDDGVLLTWTMHSYQAVGQDLQKFTSKWQRSRSSSITQKLANLSPEEDRRVLSFAQTLPPGAAIYSMRKTMHDIKYRGILIRNIPSFCFVVSLEHTKHSHPQGLKDPVTAALMDLSLGTPRRGNYERRQSVEDAKELEAGREHNKADRNGFAMMKGKRSRKAKEDYEHLHLSGSLSRPTYVRVHRKYMDPTTLKTFNLPWEWDENDPNYLIIKKWIPERDQDLLFEHSRRWFEHNEKWRSGKLRIGIGEELRKERQQLLSPRTFLDKTSMYLKSGKDKTSKYGWKGKVEEETTDDDIPSDDHLPTGSIRRLSAHRERRHHIHYEDLPPNRPEQVTIMNDKIAYDDDSSNSWRLRSAHRERQYHHYDEHYDDHESSRPHSREQSRSHIWGRSPSSYLEFETERKLEEIQRAEEESKSRQNAEDLLLKEAREKREKEERKNQALLQAVREEQEKVQRRKEKEVEIRASEKVGILNLSIGRVDTRDKKPAEQKDPLRGRDDLRLDFDWNIPFTSKRSQKSTITPSSRLLSQPDPVTRLGTSAQSPQSPSLEFPDDDIVDQLLAKYTTVFEESDGNSVDVP